jgi:hypothetical protein
MSEELLDEIEAINSIYGEGCLVQSPSDSTVYVLSIPDAMSSLQLQFPANYPDVPPAVIGTHSSGEHGKRGSAARDLENFRAAVAAVYEPGQVCLFDAIEKLKELVGAAADDDDTPNDVAIEEEDAAMPPTDSSSEFPEPAWILSDPVIELKSTFVARCAKVTSPDEAAYFVQHLLASDKKIRSATHNMTAWRIRGPNGTSFQDCDDDGETAAGGRLLHLMQLMDLWDAMVVVTRWYGGHKLGPRRFALINTAARDAFVKAGWVTEQASASNKKKHHGT